MGKQVGADSRVPDALLAAAFHGKQLLKEAVVNAIHGGDEDRATAVLEQWARHQAAATGAVLQSFAEGCSSDVPAEPPARSPQ